MVGRRAPAVAQQFRDCGGIDLGHSYKGKRQKNGNYALENVDIFVACQRKNNATGKTDDFSKAWMEGAISRFDELKRKGYLPPAHLDHHGKDGFSQPNAGKVGAMRLGVNGDGVATIFADVIDIPPEIFAQMLRGRLSYRSVEVNNPEVPEISSLAFMATTVPYHKLPLLNVDFDESAMFAGRSRCAVLFAETYGLDEKGNSQYGTAIVQKFYGGGGGSYGYAPMNRPTAAMQRMAHDDENGGGADGDGAADDDDLQLSEEDLQQLLPYLQQQQQQQGGMGQEMPGEGVQDMPGGEGDEMEAMMAANPSAVQQLIALQTEANQKLDALLKGGGGIPSQVTPPPVAASEPKTGAQNFSSNGNGHAAGADARETAGLRAAVESLQKKLAEAEQRTDYLFMERQRDAMWAHFSQQAGQHISAMQQDMLKKFTPDQTGKVLTAVHQRFNEKIDQYIEANLPDAMTNEKSEWFKADVGAFFAEERNAIPGLGASSAKQNFSDAAPPKAVSASSAAPRSTGEVSAANGSATDDEMKKFQESLPENDKRAVAKIFSKAPEIAKKALNEARAAWNALPAESSARVNFKDANEFAFAAIASASNANNF